MFRQRTCFDKPLSASITHERPLSTVYASVDDPVAARSESFAAHAAGVRLAARMQTNVLLETRAGVERLHAEVADEGPFTCVQAPMMGERGAMLETFPAYLARELQPQVEAFVGTEIGLDVERHPALFTLERFLIRVDDDVTFQMRVLKKCLSALLAAVGT